MSLFAFGSPKHYRSRESNIAELAIKVCASIERPKDQKLKLDQINLKNLGKKTLFHIDGFQINAQMIE